MEQRKLSGMELASFCGQLALILRSGISAVEGIVTMLEDTVSATEKEILEKILKKLEETGNLSMALSDAGVFPAYMLHMVEIGEEAGALDEVMHSLEIHYEREESIKRTVRNAITYPLIMAGMMIIVIAVLLIRVMPVFNQVFVQLGTELTGFSGHSWISGRQSAVMPLFSWSYWLSLPCLPYIWQSFLPAGICFASLQADSALPGGFMMRSLHAVLPPGWH